MPTVSAGSALAHRHLSEHHVDPFSGQSDSVEPFRQELGVPDEQILPLAESARRPRVYLCAIISTSTKTPVDKDQVNERIDFNESAKSQWFGRYSWAEELTINPGLTLDGASTYTHGPARL